MLAEPERDRLYREWVLPHLQLSDAHRRFAEEILRVPDGHGMYSYEGEHEILLEERAPFEQLKLLPCCVIKEQLMSLAGPREGALLLPMLDPRGRITAFQMLDNSQIEKIQAGDDPGAIRWWQATGAIRPMLPNGELPILAERGEQSQRVVIGKGLALASSLARRWKTHAISTTEDTFSAKLLDEYLQEFHTRDVELLVPREPNRKECSRVWDLAQKLYAKDWRVKMLIPVLSDFDVPDSYDQCSAVSVECWFEGQPRTVRNYILGKTRPGQLNDKLKHINEVRHISATAKIKAAYEDIISAGDSTSINGLARAANVNWKTVREWLKDQGIKGTQALRTKMEDGWEPEFGPTKPPPPPPPEPVPKPAAPPDDGAEDELPLFAFAAGKLPEPEKPAKPEEPEEPKATGKDEANADNELPVKADENSVDEPGDSGPKFTSSGIQDDPDATIELIVEASESILEEETPLTQTMPEPEDDEYSNASNVSEDRRVVLLISAVAILVLVVSVMVILSSGLKQKGSDVIKPLPTEDELVHEIGPEHLRVRKLEDVPLRVLDEKTAGATLDENFQIPADDEALPIPE